MLLIWTFGEENTTIEIVDHEEPVIISHLAVIADLICHFHLRGEIRLEVGLDHLLNLLITVELEQ